MVAKDRGIGFQPVIRLDRLEAYPTKGANNLSRCAADGSNSTDE